MPTQAGHLLLSRRALMLSPGTNLINTGICQTDHALAPDPGVAERLVVQPLPPLSSWVFASIMLVSQPRWVGKTIEVELINQTNSTIGVNVLFWVPHSSIGPISADPYLVPPSGFEGPRDEGPGPSFGPSDAEPMF